MLQLTNLTGLSQFPGTPVVGDVAMFDGEEGPDGGGPLLSLKVGVRKRKYQSLNSISVILDERVSTKYQEITF